MNGVIGDLLPLALGVAISPVPIIAVILMLLAPHAKAAAWAFLVGWIVGLSLVVTVVLLVLGPVDDSESGNPTTLVSWIKIVLGVFFLVLAALQWRSRPREGQEPKLPSWMSAADHVTPGRALGIGAALSGINPKNLSLALSAGVSIASAGLDEAQTVTAGAVFVVLGSLSVAAPVVAYTVAQDRMRNVLNGLRDWLTANNAAVMTVLLLVIGVMVIGKGIAGL